MSILVNATVEARLLLCVARAVLLPADAGHGVCTDRRRDPELSLHLGQAVHFLGDFWLRGSDGRVVARRSRGALRVDAEGGRFGTGSPRYHLPACRIGRRSPRWITGEMSGASGWARVRRSLGEIWHLLAIVYVVGIYLIYALRIEGGFVYVLRATALSLIVIVAAQVVVRFVQGLSRRGFAIKPELRAQFPTLEQRANRYIPILTGLTSGIVYVVATVAVLQAGTLGNLRLVHFRFWPKGCGKRGVDRHGARHRACPLGNFCQRDRTISKPDRCERRTATDTHPHFAAVHANSNAVRDSRPNLVIILSHIGIDITPLLAGAGVVGLAIGFGSQALVKDIITGLFILMEDQLAVGDIVDVGKDHKGVVEAITVRTIRMRDLSGTVHIVPFSEVASLKNLTKEFSYAVARITISYSEDIDHVVEILRQVSDELMEDEALRPFILNSFDYMGVDALEEFSVVLLVRIRTVPGKQLAGC